jgi:DNA-binding transcriptional regulator YdaS (Cro superfamily)
MSDNKRVKNVIYWLMSQELIESQEDFAKKLGYNSSSLSQIVSGVKPISRKFALNVAAFCNKINPDYLIGHGEMLKGFEKKAVNQSIVGDNNQLAGGNIILENEISVLKKQLAEKDLIINKLIEQQDKLINQLIKK